MNETRFTERAQAALRLAQEGSAELGHGYVGSEHLLLGLAREGKGVAAKVLQSAGVEPEGLKAAIAGLVGMLVCGMGDYIWYYPRAMMLFWFVFGILVAAARLAKQEADLIPAEKEPTP